MSEELHALVVSVGKNAAWVSLEGEQLPRLAQLRRASGRRAMPVPGDEAEVRLLEDGSVVVEHLAPRRFELLRRSVDGRTKIMAANVDLLVTVTALADPPPRLLTLDQLLAFASLDEIEALVVFTKPDLGEPAVRDALLALYARIGYRVVLVDPKHGGNVDGLRAALAGRRALLTGNSGVGKSSIFRALGGEAIVGEVSRHGLGRQTTTAARLYRMNDGFLIDSPGVNEFGLGAVTHDDLTRAFVEFPQAAHCRFTDCKHLQEPDCGVHAAVAGGRIARSRYDSYRHMLLNPT